MAAPVQIQLSYRSSFENGLWRLRLWVSATENCPPWVFLMRVIPDMPVSSHDNKALVRVCSYSDMNNYPAESSDAFRCHFRVDHLDLSFTALSDMDEMLTNIQTDITHLTDDIYNVTSATPVTTTTVVT